MNVPGSFLVPMKRLVRSALDPLPRSLSIRSLAILVTMLVAGIAISVHEYLESGRLAARTPTARSRPVEMQAPARCARETRSISPAAAFEIEATVPDRATASEPPVEAAPATTAAPGIWIPESRSTGS